MPDSASESALLDLYATRIAETQAGPAARNEAYDDAVAYGYDDLLPRFGEAAGAPLRVTERPILAHMLKAILAEVGGYSKQAKIDGGRRLRPYAEVGEITACHLPYLHNNESYPSGHSTNGYSAALLLSDVFADRKAALLARGARYGDNRVICGVHHPIDVERGRSLSLTYFAAVRTQPAYREDMMCAIEESAALAAKPRQSLSAPCAKKAETYRAEVYNDRIVGICADWPVWADKKPGYCS